jgi:enoyl-CoA hydratase/carnithine racemase
MYEIAIPPTLSLDSLTALARAIAAAPRDRGVWLLTGSVGRFCTGMDLSGAAGTTPEVDASIDAYSRCLDAIRRAPRPTVAVVNGEVAGGGVGLAVACDMVLATPRSTFALPESVFGLLPSLVLPVLVERIPSQRARLLALSAGSIDAPAAERLGLVDKVVGADGMKAELVSLDRTLSRIQSDRVERLRRWMLDLPLLDWPAQLVRGAALTAELVKDEGTRDGIRRFLEEGTPPWVAREERA